MIAINRIVVGSDFSAASAAALLHAMTLARTCRAQLDVVHVVHDLRSGTSATLEPTPNGGRLQTEMEAMARHALDALLTGEDRRLLRARAVLLTSSHPAERIVSYARDARADVIVIGTHGKTGISNYFFMGSVAQHVVRSAPCPVLTVRQPQREGMHADRVERLVAS